MNLLLGIAWENILIGLIGGLLVSFLTYIKTFIKNKRMEKKFPISGEYISNFEDEIEGTKVTCTAPAVLKQNGNKIKGYTIFEEDDRKWVLEGEISNEGHIHGIYYAENPIDKGIGNFFLKVDNKRNMIGLWSGFDSANNRIESGRYRFKPVRQDIIIKAVEHRYIPHIISIADRNIGEQYLTEELINNCINDTNNYICKVAIDNDSKKVVGFYISYIVNPQSINTVINVTPNQIPRMFKYPSKIGVLKTIAVDNKYQGYSIGTLLSKDSIEEFRARNVPTICTIAWKSKNGTNLEGVLKRLNFEKVLEIKDYWKEDSINNSFECPVCGEPPCRCSAEIFGLNIL